MKILRLRQCFLRTALVICLSGFLAEHVRADHPTTAFGGGAGGPINTIGASTLEQGKSAIALRFDDLQFKPLSNAQLISLGNRGIEADSLDYTVAGFLTWGYGVTDDITFALRLPYYHQHNIREPDFVGGVEHEGNSSGFGDLLILGIFRLWNFEEEKVQISFIGGLETPTGRTHALSAEGDLLETEHQPGSGSWDTLTGLALTKNWEKWSFHTNVAYGVISGGTQHTDLGNVFTYNAALVYRVGQQHSHADGHSHDGGEEHSHDDHVHPAGYFDHEHSYASQSSGSHSHDEHSHEDHWHPPTLDLMAEINGIKQDRNLVGAEWDNNTGGNVVYLSPGARVTFNAKWSLFFSGGIPIFQDQNGFNHVVAYRLTAGTAIVY